MSIATLYHEVRSMRWQPDGSPQVVVQPAATYLPSDDPMLPGPPSGLADDLALAAYDAARAGGLEPVAWLSLTHRDGMTDFQQRFATRDPWGNRSTYALCPSHAEVRAASVALIRTVHERGGVTAFQVEALGALGFEHGVAHDKADFAWLGRGSRRALSTCCCDGCTALAGEHGIELEAAAAALRDAVGSRPDDADGEIFEALDEVRRLATARHVREIADLADSIGADITVAVSSDRSTSGPFAAIPELDDRLHPYALLDDPAAWNTPGRSGAVLEMRPPASFADALGDLPLESLDDLYLYHLGTRRPDTLDPRAIHDIRREHRRRREAA
ncbi:MAG TPA: hypothetical protein VN200_06170 [Rhodoglobus sp.]|nr:hypothetical protein [Rhodoglobus sp.]